MDEKKVQEMQVLEHKLQNSILQKQSFQIELAETESALSELDKAGDEVFKIIGQLMIKSEKLKIKQELLDKKKILEIKINSFEKQEKILSSQLDKLQEEISPSIEK